MLEIIFEAKWLFVVLIT